jgi:hypothetical protein
LGGNNAQNNLVLLTPREHYVAHWLLYKIHTGKEKAKLAFGFFKMCQRNHQQTRTATSKMFERARLSISEACMGTNAPGYGKHRTDEEKRNLSVKRSGKGNPMYGIEPWNKGLSNENSEIIKLKTEQWRIRFDAGEYTNYTSHDWTEESRQKISQLFKDKPKTKDHKAKLSLSQMGRTRDREAVERSATARKGMKQPSATCPHCGKTGAHSAMHRWHFDKCKLIT